MQDQPGSAQFPRALRLLLRARIVLPLSAPPLEDAAVLVEGNRISRVGPYQQLRSVPCDHCEDLGEVILAPGLVNAHCHLDYTDMAGKITPPRSFSDWIKALLALKAHCAYSDFAISWVRGAKMLLRHGVTTVADIEAVPELLPEVSASTPLRVCSLLEMTGVRSRRPATEIVHEAAERITSLSALGLWAGLSPHAPYSTTPELLRLSGQIARANRWPLAVHVAESQEEFDMFTHCKGPMYEWLRSQRTMSDCGQGSPVQHLARAGLLGPEVLAVHVNYLAPGDADLLASTNIVHCPRSHAYFGHSPFPHEQLQAAGANICLGTDSLASTHVQPGGHCELDLLAEMRAMAQTHPNLSPQALLQMGTTNAAAALGKAGVLGQLSEGAAADLFLIPSTCRPKDACAAVVAHGGPVHRVMLAGNWVSQCEHV